MRVWSRLCRRYPSVFRNRRKKPGRLLFLLPGLMGVTLFVFLPFLDVGKRSFQTAVTGEFCGIDNFVTIFQKQAFLLALSNTAKFVGVGVPLLILLSLLVSLLIDKMVHASMWKALFLFPMAVPTATVVLIWKLFFHENGLLNAGLNALGIHAVDWMGSGASFWVLIFSYLWKNMGYTVVLWMVGLHNVSAERKEAAKVDGAGGLQCFFYVVWPELKPMLYTTTILSFLNSFKVFREAYLVAGAYPDRNMYLLQHLFNNWFTNLEMDKMAAASVCITLVFLGGVILLRHFWEKQE